jgi:hypothetical protein
VRNRVERCAGRALEKSEQLGTLHFGLGREVLLGPNSPERQNQSFTRAQGCNRTRRGATLWKRFRKDPMTSAIAALASLCLSATPCASISNAEPLLVRGAKILLGEMHGNVQTPRFVGELACAASKRGAVRVGLEIPNSEQARIDSFLASSGSTAARAALLKGPFWNDSYQDGRKSQAMVVLLETLRRLRQQGADVGVVLFDSQAQDRNLGMAENLRGAFAAAPKAVFIVLTGNLHARRTPGEFSDTFMAARLAEKGVDLTALDARYGRGTTWACMSGDTCGPIAFGRGPDVPLAVVMKPSADGAYDGTFEVGAPIFSPPAAVPVTAAQQARIDALRL